MGRRSIRRNEDGPFSMGIKVILISPYFKNKYKIIKVKGISLESFLAEASVSSVLDRLEVVLEG